MTFKPAHKVVGTDGAPGQIVNPVYGFDRHPHMKHSTAEVSGRKEDTTLGDYVARKQKEDSFASVNAEKKLTFEQWALHNFIFNRVHGMVRKDSITLEEALQLCWKAAQENV